MSAVSALLATLTLAAAPSAAPTDASLWQAVFTLDSRTDVKRTAAEDTLLQGGAPALGVLLKAARMGGRDEALSAGGPIPSGCIDSLSRRFISNPKTQERKLSTRAAELVGRLLKENAALRRQTQRSPEAFDRAAAMAVAARAPELRVEALAAMRQEPEPWLKLWADSFASCLVRNAEQRGDGALEALRAEAAFLSERANTVRGPYQCLEPADLEPALVDELALGVAFAGGSSGVGEQMLLNVTREDESHVSLSPACALATYDAVAAKRVWVDALLEPLFTQLRMPPRLRKAASDRLTRDLEHVTEKRRNRLAAQLVNEGFRVPVTVTWDEQRGVFQEEELEAAMRQGHPTARAAIQRSILCRDDLRQVDVALLGFLGTKAAADKAAEIAQQCPRGATAATAALVRMKDARAAKFLPKAVEDWGFEQQPLQRACLEAYTPKLGQQLKALQAGGSRKAGELLELLRIQGVMKD